MCIGSLCTEVPQGRCSMWQMDAMHSVGLHWTFIANSKQACSWSIKSRYLITQGYWLHKQDWEVAWVELFRALKTWHTQQDLEEYRSSKEDLPPSRQVWWTLVERVVGQGSGSCPSSLQQPSTSLSETSLGSLVEEMELDEMTKNIYSFI